MAFNANAFRDWIPVRKSKRKGGQAQAQALSPVQAAQERPQQAGGGKPLGPFLQSMVKYNPGEIVIRVIYVIGKQRTGKTTLVNAMVSDIQAALGDKVDYRITNDIRDLLSKEWMGVKDKPFLIRLIDDAGRMQFSRKGMERAQLAKIIDMKEIAHIALEAGFQEGCITVFYGAQNETLVDFQLRSEAEITMIKWLNLSIKEHRELLQGLKNFNEHDREDVERWIDGIRLREIPALSRALVIFPTRRWGWYSYEKKECRVDQQVKHYEDEDGETVLSVTKKEKEREAPIPFKALSADGQADLKVALAEVIAKLKADPQWKAKVECYEMVRGGATENDAAIKILGGASKQGTVNHWKKQAQGEIARRLGAIYENAVILRLSQQGYSVQHLGGSGEPDIIAVKEGRITVVSCKIYDDPRKVVSIDQEQFRPEINYAAKNGLEKFLLCFYNLAWEREIIREVDRDAGTVTLRRSECECA